MRAEQGQPMTAETKIKAILAVISLAGFFFGVVKFIQVQTIAARTPYLEHKLEWCEAAVRTTAAIATTDTPSEEDLATFWQMSWGVMGLIEGDDVFNAMVAFGDALNNGEPGMGGSKGDEEATGLTKRSLDLAHACRRELAREWSSSWAR